MFFNKKKKKQEEVLQQDLTQTEHQGLVFMMQLLMKEKCPMPDPSRMEAVMRKHLGDVDHFAHNSEVSGFAVKKYAIACKEGTAAPMLMITGCCESAPDRIDALTRSQMWDCPEREQILSTCGYQVVATDMLAGAMEPHDRAEMLMDYMEALVELFPSCEAVYFYNSGKMFTADKIRSHSIPRSDRFIYFAVNARFFNIQGTEDMLIDTLGMSVLSLPDLQYHFHGMDPNPVVNHAYNLASYIFANHNPIKDGETVDGIAGNAISRDVHWQCHFEDALIQPPREVLDICMGELASGNREYN